MASSKKKVVNKDDLRRLMKEKKGVNKPGGKRIDSPLAKYNSLDQLICIVCNTHVKSDLQWNAHIMGRTHKENLTRLKAAKEEKTMPTVQAPPPPSAAPRGILKRKHSNDLEIVKAKIAKAQGITLNTGVPSDFFDDPSKKPAGLVGASYGDDSSDEEDSNTPQPLPPTTKATSSKSKSKGAPDMSAPELPPDFFDSSKQPSTSTDNPVEPSVPKVMAEKLPEGFFDDPKEDAKVRQVEYKDKMEEEWALFQKTMKEQASISEAIVEEDDDNAITERNLDEIDEQYYRWSKVEELAKKKEEVMSKGGDAVPEKEENDSDLDEQEFDEFLDWRTKKAWK